MKKLHTIASTVLFILCASCVTDLSQDVIRDVPKLLVVHSFISPQDTLVRVNVTAIEGVTGTFDRYRDAPQWISDAQVLLSDGTDTVSLKYLSEGELPEDQNDLRLSYPYIISADMMPILAGKTYWLTVRKAGLPEVTASCMVPEDKVKFNVEFKQVQGTNSSWLEETIEWQDFEGDKNWYRLLIDEIWIFKKSDTTLVFYDDYIENYKVLYNDENKDGTVFFSKQILNIDTANFQPQNPSLEISNKRTINVLNVDENYYNYHEALFQEFELDDRFSEPYFYPTNIEGGLGVFGAYNRASEQVVF